MMPDHSNLGHRRVSLNRAYSDELVAQQGLTALERGIGFTIAIAGADSLDRVCEPLAGPCDGREPDEWLADAMLAYHLERREERCAQLEAQFRIVRAMDSSTSVEYWRERAQRAEALLREHELRRRSAAFAGAFRSSHERPLYGYGYEDQ